MEDNGLAAIWLECGLPNQKGFLICMGYKQWQLLNQNNSMSASVSSQLERWNKFLGKWELALSEDKEVIVALDANIDHLTWRSQNLHPSSSSSKLKPLIDALFNKIIQLNTNIPTVTKANSINGA